MQQQEQQTKDPAYYDDYYQSQSQEWRYEMRREMQEILPGLFIGPFQVAKDVQALQASGITHILILRDLRESHLLRELFPTNFVYHSM